MKKTMLFVIGMLVLSTATSLILPYYTSQTSYPIQDLEGDRSVINGVSFTTGIMTPTRTVNVSYDKQLKASQNLLTDYEEAYTEVLFPQYVLPQDVSYLSDWKKSEDNGEMDGHYERKVSRFNINFSLSLPPGSGVVQEFPTDLYYEASDDLTLLQTGLMEEVGNEDIIKPFSEEVPDEPATLYSSPQCDGKGTCYFMPSTNTAMKGVNYIYKVHSDSKIGDDYSYKLNKTRPLVKLPLDRIYDYLLLYQDSLYVLSHKGNDLYVTRYDTEGRKEKEVRFTQTSLSYETFRNDNYFLWYEKERVYALNLTSMEMEAVCDYKLPQEDDENYGIFPRDILYKNKRFYISCGNESIPYTISVIQDNKFLYKGSINLLGTKLTNDESLIWPYAINQLIFER